MRALVALALVGAVFLSSAGEAGAATVPQCMAVTGATYVAGTNNSLAVKDGTYFPFPSGQMLRCKPSENGVEFALGMVEQSTTGGGSTEIDGTDLPEFFSFGLVLVMTSWFIGKAASAIRQALRG